MTTTRATDLLRSLRIASPCHADWEKMERVDDEAGTAGAVRFCGMCRKNVYDLSAMTADDAVSTIQRQEGTLCLRLFRRHDGTVLHRDCPRGARRLAKHLVRAGMLVLFVAGIGLASWMVPHLLLRDSPVPGQIQDGWQKLISELRTMFGISRPSPPIMGVCAPPSPAVPLTPASPGSAEAEGA